MDSIVKPVVEKVRHLKNNTDEVIIKIEVKSKLDEPLKAAIRLKIKTHFPEDSVYFLTDSNYLIVDWSLHPPLKTKLQKLT